MPSAYELTGAKCLAAWSGPRRSLQTFDAKNHREIVAEFPTDGRDPDELAAEIEARFPAGRYVVGTYRLGKPGPTAIPEARSWEASDFFSDWAEREQES